MADGKWVIHADGASRGNPGPSSVGAVIYDDSGRELHTVSQRIGRAKGGGHHLYITRMESKQLAGCVEFFFDVRFL